MDNDKKTPHIWIAVIGALASIVVAIITTKGTISSSSDEISEYKASVIALTAEISEKEAELKAIALKIEELNQEISKGRFGSWERKAFSQNTVYQAKTDGFIAAYSRGNNPEEAFLQSGPTSDDLSSKTRVSKYGGALIPIAKGTFWKALNTESGDITISWIPMK